MPVVGHAFVGMAIGMFVQPSRPTTEEAADAPASSIFWLPAMVVLSYLPDVVTQVGLLARWEQARLLGHSVVFAIAVSPPIGAMLARGCRVSLTRACTAVLVCLLAHDLLDLAQATDRAPWWPLSERRIGTDIAVIPRSFVFETILFGGVLLLVWAALELRATPTPRRQLARHGAAIRGSWPVRVFVVAIVLAAVVMHSLRDKREYQFDVGRALIEQGAYRRGLELLTQAEAWPWTMKPGRIDYLRAEAYYGLGDRSRAENLYLRAFRADPSYFWVSADLAYFYASSDATAAERRRAAAPYLDKLRRDFDGHQALSEAIARVERKLAAGTDAQDLLPAR